MARANSKPVTLRDLSTLLGLSQSTISRILNGEAASHRIAPETQQRVLQTAALHGYTPNAVARSLRQKRSYTVGVLVPEISEGYSTAVLSGIEDELLREGFFYFVASHRHRAELLDGYPRMLIARSVEGIIAVDTPIETELRVPVVSVSGHHRHPGIINIDLDHGKAAMLALSHLKELGHRSLAVIKGQSFSSDTRFRWDAIRKAARSLEITLEPELVVQLESPEPGIKPGILATRELLGRRRPFTAIFAFNDLTAIGAIQAIRESGYRVPDDVSVIGFDDILAASTHDPPLTTVRQPLRDMGQAAANTLLKLIDGRLPVPFAEVMTVEPSFVMRRSTGPARQL